MYKFLLVVLLLVGYGMGTSVYFTMSESSRVENAAMQLREDRPNLEKENHYLRNNGYGLGWCLVFVVSGLLYLPEFRSMLDKMKGVAVAGLILLSLSLTGCWRPFEPVKLEVIAPNEIGFLVPLTGDTKNQSVTENEEYYKSKLVMAKQVKIPQQWVPLGFEYMGPNGQWKDAAVLIKVDLSPETREWTADEASGTSNRNEAIWVMTSDQVEFSTGWTITARIADQEAAMKFLHNYRNGSLEKILDREVRAKLQSTFTFAVTDLPMDELRKNATPVIAKVSEEVKAFFAERGIQITNIGITGGFVYKDKTIQDTLVKVFNAEQEKNMAIAQTQAQTERNKSVILEAQGKADALMKTKKAEADGIKLVADAKVYEIEQSKKDLETYLKLKSIELSKDMLQKWNGKYPEYFMGTGQSLNTLLQLPNFDPKVEKAE
jgi:regulator of protease activity HflC (stomatin/prohibitin superfamily)